MNDSKQNSRDISELKGESAVKKPYLKPAFRQERLFETSALSCGKVQATQGNCKLAGRKTS